jgi:hypothetical protein
MKRIVSVESMLFGLGLEMFVCAEVAGIPLGWRDALITLGMLTWIFLMFRMEREKRPPGALESEAHTGGYDNKDSTRIAEEGSRPVSGR